MARTALTKTILTGSYPTAGVPVTFAAADNTNGNSFTLTGAEVVLARNEHATLAKTATLSSVASATGRSGDISGDSIAVGDYHVYGPFKNLNGWRQSGGLFHLTAESTDIKFAVLVLPRP